MTRGLGFSAADAATVSFGISCQWEVVGSLRALTSTRTHPAHAPWVRTARSLVRGRELGVLADLVGSAARRDYLPDFLTPPPTTRCSSLEEDLAVVQRTDPGQVRAELDLIRSRWTPSLAALHAHPEEGLVVLVEQIRRYWAWAIAPWWRRIQCILELDVFRRAHQLAEQGTGAVLNDLHNRVTWDGRRLEVAGTTCVGDLALDGTGLRLVPSVFVWPDVLVVVDRVPAQLAYPVSAAATVWSQEPQKPVASPLLAAVVGRSKAQLLGALSLPSSSQMVARQVGLSPASVSEHLRDLREAGLIVSYRLGRRLVNVRTEAGTALVEAAEAAEAPGTFLAHPPRDTGDRR